MLPLVELTADGEVHKTGDVVDALARRFELSAEDLEELLPSGSQRRFWNRVNWATTGHDPECSVSSALENAGLP